MNVMNQLFKITDVDSYDALEVTIIDNSACWRLIAEAINNVGLGTRRFCSKCYTPH